MSRSLKAHLLLLFATFVWGATFIVIKSALADASPLVFNAARMALASVVLIALFFRQLCQLPAGALRAGIEVGTLMWLGYEFQTAGLLYTSASKSAFLTGLSVILVPLLLAVFWRRHINRYTLGGVLAALAGLYLTCVPAGQGLSLASLNRGDLMTLACAVAFAFQIIVLGRSAQHYDFVHLVPVEIASCAAWMVLSIPVAERHGHIHFTPGIVWALAITALIGTVACFVIQAWAQRFTPPTHTALIFAMEPVFAGLTSYVFLGERLGARGTAGAGLILAGVLLSELMGHVQEPKAELQDELG
ncbi:MAG: DMT family transporter [Acidobacteriota bacterium]|nr:DMT family transporter [Acidobacteriota bacterium]